MIYQDFHILTLCKLVIYAKQGLDGNFEVYLEEDVDLGLFLKAKNLENLDDLDYKVKDVDIDYFEDDFFVRYDYIYRRWLPKYSYQTYHRFN